MFRCFVAATLRVLIHGSRTISVDEEVCFCCENKLRKSSVPRLLFALMASRLILVDGVFVLLKLAV